MHPSAILRELTSVPTAPFREQAVTRVVLAWMRTHLPRSVKVRRHRGGLSARYMGAGAGPALGLAAHLDHPAFKLKGEKGELQGGLPAHLLPGEWVEAWPAVPTDNRPLAEGRLGKPGKDGLYPIEWVRPPKGAAFATLRLVPWAIEGEWLVSRSIDDLLGCAVSLEALRRLAAARAKANVLVLLNRAEEVGFIGAMELLREGAVSKDDSLISVESSRELPGARPGRGPVVRLGDKAAAFDPNLIALLDEAAGRMKGPVQRLRLTGGTCEATAYLAAGYEAAGVAVPLVNYHNGWGAEAVAPEKVRLEDCEGAVRLLVEAAKLFPGRTLRGALRARLDSRHKRLRGFL